MGKGFRIIKFKKQKPVFEVKDISKSFSGRQILKKLSLKVNPGECVGILGANGAGKSTLFSIAIGEQNPDQGKIYLNGKAIHEVPIHLRSKEGLGYLPQHRSVFNLSVVDNLLAIAQISIKDPKEQKNTVEKLLNEWNLQHLRNLNAASSLSGGEVRRLMLARMMINKPKIVLLDEPYYALDPMVIRDIQTYLKKIQMSGTSILVNDHQYNDLFDIVDRAYVLGNHSVVAEGTPRELLKSQQAIEKYFGKEFSS